MQVRHGAEESLTIILRLHLGTMELLLLVGKSLMRLRLIPLATIIDFLPPRPQLSLVYGNARTGLIFALLDLSSLGLVVLPLITLDPCLYSFLQSSFPFELRLLSTTLSFILYALAFFSLLLAKGILFFSPFDLL